MNPGRLTTRWRLILTTSNGGASSPWRLASSSPSWLTNVVLPVSRGPNSATFVWPFNVNATRLANASMPTIFAGSSSGRSHTKGLSAPVMSWTQLYRSNGTERYPASDQALLQPDAALRDPAVDGDGGRGHVGGLAGG